MCVVNIYIWGMGAVLTVVLNVCFVNNLWERDLGLTVVLNVCIVNIVMWTGNWG
jgi:hypothetical protein